MSEWKAKRFWKKANVSGVDGGFTVLLDERPVRTPAKAQLVVPTRALATAIAVEWDAQDGAIDPLSMPVTRSANAAIDKVATQHSDVVKMLADYGDADLICYRATTPVELIARQADVWDPLVDWAARDLNAPLVPVSGVVHKPQSPASLARLQELVDELDPFTLAAFHDLVALSGSLVIGFAALRDYAPIDELWEMSRVDEVWQEEQWGRDDEAVDTMEIKRDSFVRAKAFAEMARKTG